MAYEAKILADSISERGERITTMQVRFPRFVLAEFNTHRMFSRNSASSRAIPVEKQLRMIREEPFVPEYWGANQSGMQAEAELPENIATKAIEEWLASRDDAIEHVVTMQDLGVHKQIANRALEAYMWHTAVVTATEWSNYFALRANKMAQPEIRYVSEMMKEQYENSVTQELSEHEWHLPLIQNEEKDGTFETTGDALKVAAARCARVSYLTHEGKRDIQADLTLYDRLVTGGHLSPLEHVATPFGAAENRVRQTMADTAMRAVLEGAIDRELGNQLARQTRFSGNIAGWTQLRKKTENEHDFSLVSRVE